MERKWSAGTTVGRAQWLIITFLELTARAFSGVTDILAWEEALVPQ